MIRRAIQKLASLRKPAARQTRRHRAVSPEGLEPRELMTVTTHGGAIIAHAETQAVFLGSDWSNSSAGHQAAVQLNNFVHYITNSTYMDMLNTYGVGRGTSSNGQILPYSINKNYYLTDTQIQGALLANINNHALTPPDPNRLYMVFVEPGVAVNLNGQGTSIKDFNAYHYAMKVHDAQGHSFNIHYAVMVYPGGYNATPAQIGVNNAMDFVTQAASHELAEAVTDPDLNNGYRDYGFNGPNEIGDLAQIVATKVYGVLPYFSLGGYCVQYEVNRNDQLIAAKGGVAYHSYYASASHSTASAGTTSLSTEMTGITSGAASLTSGPQGQPATAGLRSTLNTSASEKPALSLAPVSAVPIIHADGASLIDLDLFWSQQRTGRSLASSLR